MFKKEVEYLALLGFLERSNNSEWGAPSFEQRKLKANQILFLCDIRSLNKKLKREPYPMPQINEILLK